MKPRSSFAFAGAVGLVLLLGACAYGGDHRDGYRTTGVDFDGYYDDAYGPITDGYWGEDGVFLFTTDQGQSYRRDDEHHVQRDASPGRHHIHGHHEDRRARGSDHGG